MILHHILLLEIGHLFRVNLLRVGQDTQMLMFTEIVGAGRFRRRYPYFPTNNVKTL